MRTLIWMLDRSWARSETTTGKEEDNFEQGDITLEENLELDAGDGWVMGEEESLPQREGEQEITKEQRQGIGEASVVREERREEPNKGIARGNLLEERRKREVIDKK